MNQTLINIGIILGLIVLIGLVAGLLIYRFWLNKENERFARLFKLTASDSHSKVTFSGIYRRYQLRISPFYDAARKNKHTMTRVSIRMQNPNKKFFYITKPPIKGKPLPSLLNDPQMEAQPILTFSAPFTGVTNDVFVTNLVLTDEIRRNIGECLNEVSQGILFLQGEELVMLSPVFPGKEVNYKIWCRQMDLLCDIKDAFQ
jgi:hypothetical protein